MSNVNSGNILSVTVLRSKLGRARGLGSAKSGLHHWWVQRLTAIALVPLSIYFVITVLVLSSAAQAEVAGYLQAMERGASDRDDRGAILPSLTRLEGRHRGLRP
jgi:hypothetical protein